MGFLEQIMMERVVRQNDGTWQQVASETFLEKEGTRPIINYIERRQAKVVEWVALYPILEVCDRDTGNEGVGRRLEPWRRQTAVRKFMSAALKYISAAARERR